jgi:hypothetical protein
MRTRTKNNGFVPPPQLDLRARAEGVSTEIILLADYKSHAWIHAASIGLTERDNSTMRGSWLLEVRLPGATDFEHDAAIALRMVLHGVTVRMIHEGRVWIDAFIDGDDPGSFQVPEPGWNQLEGATKCEHRNCKRSKHLVVDEGKYIPVPNFALFERLRGLRVEIITGFGP